MFHILARGVIDIYYSIVSHLDQRIVMGMFDLLDNRERETYHCYKFQDNKNEFLSGRYLIKTVLARQLGIEPRNIVIEKNEDGKLFLSELFQDQAKGEIKFNISHSRGIVVLAATLDFELGVDVEKVDRPIDDIVERFFTIPEKQYVFSFNEPQRNAAAYKLWTLKEAYIKAQGKGLSMPLDSFDILNAAKQMYFMTIQPRPDYYLSVGAQGEPCLFQNRVTEIDINRHTDR